MNNFEHGFILVKNHDWSIKEGRRVIVEPSSLDSTFMPADRPYLGIPGLLVGYTGGHQYGIVFFDGRKEAELTTPEILTDVETGKRNRRACWG